MRACFHTLKHTHTHLHTQTNLHTHRHTRTHTHTHTHIDTHTGECNHSRARARMCVRVCVCVQCLCVLCVCLCACAQAGHERVCACVRSCAGESVFCRSFGRHLPALVCMGVRVRVWNDCFCAPRVCLGGCVAAGAARRRPAVLIARPAAPGRPGVRGCVRCDRL
jgi:hypothetical protein